MKIIKSVSFVLLSWSLCWGQSTLVGGRCEGCEAIDEFSDKILTWTDTLPDFNIPGPLNASGLRAFMIVLLTSLVYPLARLEDLRQGGG